MSINFYKKKQWSKRWIIQFVALLILLIAFGLSIFLNIKRSVGKHDVAKSPPLLVRKRILQSKKGKRILRAKEQFEFIKLNYANAKNIADMIKEKGQGLLSKSGVVSYDQRTNSLFVKEKRSKLKIIKQLIRQLDIPVSQVMIAMRIVNVDTDAEKALGLKFQIQSKNGAASSLITSTVSPLAAGILTIAKNTRLDLALTALEKAGKAEMISNPRLMTANQKRAEIQAGEEIPYQESSGAQGATKTAFKKAVLSLQVTPHITPGHQIILQLNIHQDRRSDHDVQGVPTIDTRQMTTQVTVNNGETLVLGGIYENTQIRGVEKVPFLGDLPGIGVLFRRNHRINTRRELLIFVTPRIIEAK